jgi:hypothetical protein
VTHTAHATPEAVRDDPKLSVEEKIRILECWAYDDAEVSVALEEGMPGANVRADQEQRILQILDELSSGIEMDHTGPSKQHGIPSGSLRSR